MLLTRSKGTEGAFRIQVPGAKLYTDHIEISEVHIKTG